MISKNTIKLIKSLATKKYRTKEQLFLVEGDKMVAEVLQSDLKIKELIITSDFPHSIQNQSINIEKTTVADHKQLKQASLLNHPQNSMAICRIPNPRKFPNQLPNALSVYLDGIQDPGNLGTIIRICDWFGIEDVFCSPDTVDLYNPKVIQASMGSFNRINLLECEFSDIKTLAKKSDTQIFGTFMDGKNIYSEILPKNSLLVMGNEGNGIRKKVEALIDKRISIPNLSSNIEKAESLNVSVATAILCSEFKRPH
ncbi:RNA methyltransferase [Prolixibacteraceae bacterium Z1-6]|uniref:RNA methyltransferase n=1 Tax=Draconibacterium aestuarii TaxID=2998507 RepID=A0A9X3F868_9BACT|nr:RNA methyltransferase [Prolixibacteraceae bacterium Z1-6]